MNSFFNLRIDIGGGLRRESNLIISGCGGIPVADVWAALREGDGVKLDGQFCFFQIKKISERVRKSSGYLQLRSQRDQFVLFYCLFIKQRQVLFQMPCPRGLFKKDNEIKFVIWFQEQRLQFSGKLFDFPQIYFGFAQVACAFITQFQVVLELKNVAIERCNAAQSRDDKGEHQNTNRQKRAAGKKDDFFFVVLEHMNITL